MSFLQVKEKNINFTLDEGDVTLDSTLLDEDGNKHIKKCNVLIDEANKDSVKAKETREKSILLLFDPGNKNG
ncbi:hypothetical protein [Clostridium sp. 1xD42-85]|nr:hypothetical protein [Clostridium sp. 1xD42-85]